MALLILLLALTKAIAAVPSVNLPINAQVPPVARISNAFDFVFSESTFASGAGSMTYALSNSTNWLYLDSPSRTLSGTPGPADVGPVAVNLVASDDTGSASMLVTLVVSANPGPGLGRPLENQLSTHGSSSAADSFTLSHSSPLSLSFLPDTFTNTNDKTVYYAICANNTPLPSWLTFDPIRLSFSGTTPESTSPGELSQMFGIKLIASDVVGFAGAVAAFELVIASHVLTFGKDLHTFNVVPGVSFNYTGFQTDLLFDGAPMKPSDLAEVTAQTPSWVVFDTKTLALSGTAPASASPQNITVSAMDVYGDKTDSVVFIQTAGNTSNFFSGAIDTLNATIGSDFEYGLSGILNSSPDLLVTVDLGSASSWLNFESNRLELTGYVSNDTEPQETFLNVTAHHGSQSQSTEIMLNITGGERGASGRAASPSQSSIVIVTPSTISQPRSSVVASGDSKSTGHRKEATDIAVPLVVFLSVALTIFLICLRSRKRRQRILNRGYLNPSKEEISYPIQTAEHREFAPEEGVVGSGMPEHRRLSLLPRIDWRRSRLSSSRAVANEGTDRPKSASWHEEVVRAIPEFSLLPEEQPSLQGNAMEYASSTGRSHNSRISALNYSLPAKRLSRQIRRQSQINRVSSLLISARQISGAGHGHGGFDRGNSTISYSTMGAGHGVGGPSGYGRVRQSTRNASILSGSSWASTSTSTNTILNNGSSAQQLRSEPSQLSSNVRSFHNPLKTSSFELLARAHTIHEHSDDDHPRRPSVRAVAYPSPIHSRALSPREAFIKRRARNRETQNPLFSAGPSSRVSSHIQPRSTLKAQHSRTSSGGSPMANRSKDSPHRFNSYNFSTRVIDTLGRISRFQSRSSFGSSFRYQSAESEAQSVGFYDGGESLQEDLDEEGNKRWRHLDYPNPLATHRSDTGSSPRADPNLQDYESEAASQGRRDDRAAQHPGVETLHSGGEKGSRAMGLGYLTEQAERSRDIGGGEEGRLVMGTKEKRPVSVDAHAGLRRGKGNTCMRGDVRDVAFL